jgi:hypothetical protein
MNERPRRLIPPGNERHPFSPPGGPERRILAEGWSVRLCWVKEDVPRPRIGADQGDFSEPRIADGLLANWRSLRQTGNLTEYAFP